jgi:hypothetical protein
METGAHPRWFERPLAELQVELCNGDTAEIRTRRVRKRKADRQDAKLKLQPFARLTNQREANKIGLALRAGATGINAVDNTWRLLCRLSQRQIDFRRETVVGPCSTTIFPVKKEIPDGLSVLFYTRDFQAFESGGRNHR